MRLLCEPLLHFVLGGVILLVLSRTPGIPSAETGVPDDANVIRIGAGDLAWIQESWMRQWQRPATRDDLVGAFTNYLKEELLAREARAMGMERDDTIVRRRLAQKMSFFVEDTFIQTEPAEAELESYFGAHRDRYRSEARLTFAHVFFDPQKRTDPLSDAHDALGPLRVAGREAAIDEMGDRLMLDPVISDADSRGIDAQFGAGFADALLGLPVSEWAGPVESAFGVHLVRIDSRTDPRTLQLEEARSRVIDDWQRDQQRTRIAAFFGELIEKYRVEIDPDVRGMVGPLDELIPQSINIGIQDVR